MAILEIAAVWWRRSFNAAYSGVHDFCVDLDFPRVLQRAG